MYIPIWIIILLIIIFGGGEFIIAFIMLAACVVFDVVFEILPYILPITIISIVGFVASYNFGLDGYDTILMILIMILMPEKLWRS